MKDLIDMLIKWIENIFKKKEPEDKLPDAIDISGAKINGLREDVRKWLKSHALEVKHYGTGKAAIITEALRAWAKAGQDVAAVCVFLIKRADGSIEGWFYDFIRPNQSGVGRHVPERPLHPLPGEGDYSTFGPEDDVYILVAGLCRDGRRNESLRCPVVPLDPITANMLIEEFVFDPTPAEFMKPDFQVEAPA